MVNSIHQNSQARVPYVVKKGDTPSILATRLLGDVRYADLIVTINRVNVTLEQTEFGIQPKLAPQSRILLPSSAEMQIYSRHYFNSWTPRKSWIKESATSVSSFLDKMYEAAHRGAERFTEKASNSRMRSENSPHSVDFTPSRATTNSGISNSTRTANTRYVQTKQVPSSQDAFETFISGGANVR